LSRARRQAGGMSPASPHSASTTPTSSAAAISPFSASASPSLFRRRLSGHLTNGSNAGAGSGGAPLSPNSAHNNDQSDDLIARVRRHSSVWNHELTTRYTTVLD
jgi:hypothetical protein